MSMNSGARWACEALKATEAKPDDQEGLLAAIRRTSETIPDPRGPIKSDEYDPTEFLKSTPCSRDCPPVKAQ
jgi:hypothetical protein